jgi:type IV secretion system protein VirB11
MLSLRTHPQQIFTLDDYEAQGILTPRQRLILEEALHTGKRLVVAGGVGSAKTSLINAFLHVLKATRKRLVLIEDDPELHCEARNCVHLRVVKGQGTLRDLVRDSLRLNPDWIVVGEVRGGEALEMLKAFQTGHSGLTTVHVDAVEHTMSRLEQAVQEVSTDPQRELIGEVIDLAVHMAKAGTSWRCTGILALHGYAQVPITEPVG